MAYNLSILEAHRQFVKSHEEMEALRAKMEDRNSKIQQQTASDISNKLDATVEELKRELNG